MLTQSIKHLDRLNLMPAPIRSPQNHYLTTTVIAYLVTLCFNMMCHSGCFCALE